MPLSRRERIAAGVVLVPGVPEHLEAPLREWVHTTLTAPSFAGVPERLVVRLHLVTSQLVAPGEPLLAAVEALAYATHEDQLLDVVDAALAFHPSHAALAQAEQVAQYAKERSLNAFVASTSRARAALALDSVVRPLDQLLEDADSLWTIAPDRRGLHRRIEVALSEAMDGAEETARAAGRRSAADDLAAARAQLYGLHPDCSSAYRLAVRAVEHAAVPVVLPQNTKATLGTVIAHLRETAATWQLPTGADASAVVTMAETLWKGHRDRHGGQPGVHTPSPAAAAVAVDLATVLVRWFSAGHIQRVQRVQQAP